ALAAEALSHALERSHAHFAAVRGERAPALKDYLDLYLSPKQRDNVAAGCPMPAAAGEVGRQDRAVSARFTEGLERMVSAIEASLAPSGGAAGRHQRALAISAAMIGGIALSRAVHKADARLSEDLLKAIRQVAQEVGGRPGRKSGSSGMKSSKTTK